jgi:hypothetical protein
MGTPLFGSELKGVPPLASGRDFLNRAWRRFVIVVIRLHPKSLAGKRPFDPKRFNWLTFYQRKY